VTQPTLALLIEEECFDYKG